jgi:hypothetical protein
MKTPYSGNGCLEGILFTRMPTKCQVSRLLRTGKFSLGDNIAGYQLKPSVIWESENPKPFKHISKHTLPLYYKGSKSWMTQLLFQGTLLNGYALKWRSTLL